MSKIKTDKETLATAINECASRISGTKDRVFIRKLLQKFVENHTIPIELLHSIPEPPQTAGKTRFDQLFDAAMALVFPGYRENTIARLIGSNSSADTTKIWRAIFPEKFKLTHVLLRAPSYQEAFALACDYGCRLSLYLFGKIPTDLTIRIMFMSESALRRHLTLREVNRKRRGAKRMQLENRQLTPRQISGARIAALGPPTHPDHSIFRYVEKKDLRRIRESKEKFRVSVVEGESFRKPRI